MTDSEFQRGFRAGLEAAASLCREGVNNQEARAEKLADDPVMREWAIRRAATWDCAADMISDIPVPGHAPA